MTDDRSFVYNLVSTYFYAAVTLQTSYRYDECLPFAVEVFYWNYFLTPTPCMMCMYIIRSRQNSSRQVSCCYGLLPVCSSPVRWTLVELPTAPVESCITYLNRAVSLVSTELYHSSEQSCITYLNRAVSLNGAISLISTELYHLSQQSCITSSTELYHLSQHSCITYLNRAVSLISS